MGVSLVFQGLRYYLQNCTRLFQYRVVPEAEHIEAKDCEVIIPTGIPCSLLSVLAAVYLNDESSLQTDKVNDVRAYGSLAAELEAAYLAHTEVGPELALCVCKATSERPRPSGGHTPILTFPLRGDLCVTHLSGRRASSPSRGKIEMGVNRVWTHRLFAPIPVSSTGQALTFPRKRGKGLKVIQRSPKRGKGSFALVLIRYRESNHTAYK